MARYVRQDPSELTFQRRRPSRWQSFLRALNGTFRSGSRSQQRMITCSTPPSTGNGHRPVPISFTTPVPLLEAYSTSPTYDTSMSMALRTACVPGVHSQRVWPKAQSLKPSSPITTKKTESSLNHNVQTGTSTLLNTSGMCHDPPHNEQVEKVPEVDADPPLKPSQSYSAETLAPQPPAPPPPPPPMPIARGVILSVPKMTRSRSEIAFAALPKPSVKMKTVNWDKIPEKDIFAGNSNVWREVFEDLGMVAELDDVDWKQLENLFALTPRKNNRSHLVKLNTCSKVSMLDGKQALHVSLGLHRLKMPTQEIIECLKDCDGERLGAERLQILHQIIPKGEQIAKLKSFSGDVSSLPVCDQFLIKLVQLPYLSILVEALLLKEDFKSVSTSFETSLRAYTQVCTAILSSTALKHFLRRILTIGNYINSGSYAGNAAGFRLKDLCKLVELRTCSRPSDGKSPLSLLDFVVKTALEKDPDSLRFVDEMTGIEEASRFDLDYVQKVVSEFEASLTKIKALLSEKELPLFKERLGQFVHDADSDLQSLQGYLKEIEALSTRMARWFCENPKTFKLSECLNLFAKLCEDVSLAKPTEQKTRLTKRVSALY